MSQILDRARGGNRTHLGEERSLGGWREHPPRRCPSLSRGGSWRSGTVTGTLASEPGAARGSLWVESGCTSGTRGRCGPQLASRRGVESDWPELALNFLHQCCSDGELAGVCDEHVFGVGVVGSKYRGACQSSLE
eukprot:933770-Rhodomonas_salina.1